MKQNKQAIFNNYLKNLFQQISSYIFPIVYVFYLPNVLSVNNFSVMAIFISYLTICGILIDFGFDLLGPKLLLERNLNKEKINDLVSTIILFKLFFSSLLSIALYAYFTSIYHQNHFTIVLMSVSVIPRSLNFYWWFMGNMEISKYALYTISVWVIFFISIYFCMDFFDDKLVVVSAGYLISNSLIMGYGFVSIAKYYKVSEIKSIIINYNIIKKAVPYFSSRIASVVYMSLGVPILARLNLNFDVAVYSVGEQLFRFAQSTVSPFVLAFYFFHEATSGTKEIMKYLTILIGCVILGYLILLLGDTVLREFVSFNEIYAEVMNYLPFYVLALITHFLASFFGFPLSNLYKNSDFANMSILYSAGFYCVLIVSLIALDWICITSLLASMIVTEFTLFLIRYWYFRKFIIKIQNEEIHR